MAEAVSTAVHRSRHYLLARQHPAGWWKGELRTNVTMEAEDLLLRQFMGILPADDLAATARWIRSQQRPDGTWSTFPGGPGDVSTTVEAYVALRLAGDAIDAPHLAAARHFVLDHGGLEASRVFTRIWLALFGEWSWDDLPAMPPELALLPSAVPFNPYDWACWARQTVVPITVVATLRPVRPLPFDVRELRSGRPAAGRRRGSPLALALGAADRALKTYGRLPYQPLRQVALRRAAEWILARQEADGGWGGIQPPWVYSMLALHLLGYPPEHPAMAAALRGFEAFIVREETPHGSVRRVEACQSPVWDTALAVTALLDAGMEPAAPALTTAGRWLVGEEIRVRGDWSVRRPELSPGGWAFEFANDGYPDVDDTAEVVLALSRLRPSVVPGRDPAVGRGIDWVIGMQCADGGWAAFDADNTRRVIERLPFCDFGAVIDPPSADVTAHAVEMLAAAGRAESPPARRGVRWLLDHQERDGSWFGRWGANYVYGTGAVVPALIAAGRPADAPEIVRACAWLVEHQNADGGWGEDLRSYSDDAWRGRGESTPSQTAWALLALLAAGGDEDAVEAGVLWLVTNQRPDGGWDEELYTGTGFPGDFYINYEMYRHVFPLSALGRYARGTGIRLA